MTVVATSFGISIALMAWISSVGFLTFGGASAPLVLSNYAVSDTLMAISRVAVGVSLVFSYPLVFTGVRDGMTDLLKLNKNSKGVFYGLTVGWLAALTGLALVIPDVSFVLAFAGATLGNALIYIFPGIMFRGAIRRNKGATKAQKREVWLALFAAVVGTGLGTMGAVQAVQSIL